MVMEPVPTTAAELCEEALEILNDPWGSPSELLPEHLRALSSELYRLRRENAGHVGEDGMPKHLPMAVNAVGSGPASGGDVHHYVCWCASDSCEWNRVFLKLRKEDRDVRPR